MKLKQLIVLLLFLSILTLIGFIHPTSIKAVDNNWERVSSLGFGDGIKVSASLEVFNGSMIAAAGNNVYSYDGSAWTRLKENAFGGATGVVDLQSLNGKIYALTNDDCTLSRGAPVAGRCSFSWSSSDATNWSAIEPHNFLIPSEKINPPASLATDDTTIYASTANYITGGCSASMKSRIFKLDASARWVKEYPGGGSCDGVGTGSRTRSSDILSHDENLYLQVSGIDRNFGVAEAIIYTKNRYETNWRVLKNFGVNSMFTYFLGSGSTTSLDFFNNRLYTSIMTYTSNSTYESQVWRATDASGANWEKVFGYESLLVNGMPSGAREDKAQLPGKIFSADDKIYFTTYPAQPSLGLNTFKIWSSSNGSDWQPAGGDGFNETGNDLVTDFQVYDGELYLATRNLINGSSVWRHKRTQNQDLGSITIQLPPKLIMTPDKLTFPNSTTIHTFNTTTNQFSGNAYLGHTITTTIAGTGDGRSYVITITGFPANELPSLKNFKMTFNDLVPGTNIDRLEAYLKTTSLPTAMLTSSNCISGGLTHICLKTITTAEAPGRNLPEADLFQAIPLKGIFVGNGITGGNVAAPGAISGFTLASHAIAVGGTVNVTGSTNELQDYLADQSVAFNWNHVSLQLGSLYLKGLHLGTRVSSGNFSSPNWYLNSSNNDPTNSGSNTFSSPPEGKIWKVDGNLNLGETTFHGAGTVVIDGDLTISDRLSCDSASTRLGFIVHGKININTDSIGCGAYTALGGNIIFKNVSSGQANGIFVARDNVKLPSKVSLTGPFNITYDAFFAANPTALYQELLTLIFTTSS